jgi:hypothetical protein
MRLSTFKDPWQFITDARQAHYSIIFFNKFVELSFSLTFHLKMYVCGTKHIGTPQTAKSRAALFHSKLHSCYLKQGVETFSGMRPVKFFYNTVFCLSRVPFYKGL